MPEGDTIHRTATTLRRALLGGVVREARAQPQPGLARVPRLERLVGRRIDAVEARGKHLLIRFAGGLSLRTHMRMRGSWHRYRPGESWRLPSARAGAVLATDHAVAVCFDCPEIELLTDADLARHRALRTLGPDLLGVTFDAADALARLRARPSVALGAALLDQRAAAGIGNVYKSEICFLEGLDPWAPVSSIPDEALLHLLSTARRLLLANAGSASARRVTTGIPVPGSSLWVYGRRGRPCRRCGTLILARRQGEQARMTYWCPHCQASRGQGQL